MRDRVLATLSTAPRRMLLAGLLVVLGLVGVVDQVRASDPCGEGSWQVGDSTVCIHVDDADTIGLPTDGPVIAQRGAVAQRAGGSAWARARDADELQLVCDRSNDRHRFQVVYVHTGNNRVSSLRPRIDRIIAQAQSQYDLSSARHGGTAALVPRFVTEARGPAGCRARVAVERVPSSAVRSDDPAAVFDVLLRRGYDDLDRNYLVMVDAVTRYCGLGTAYVDDDPSPRRNANNNRGAAPGPNRLPGFSRVDRTEFRTGSRISCWEVAVAHEIGHNLGAVQPTAPHTSGLLGDSTPALHCTDGLDAMCYDDGGSRRYSSTVCTDADAAFVLDCNADDYFDPTGSRGGYLASNWNIADSDWLLATDLRAWSRGGTVAASGTVFDDVSHASAFSLNITALQDAAITRGCNPPANTRFCPTDVVSREQMAAFLVRALDLPRGSTRFRDVPGDSIFRADIAALAAAGITRGCNPPANDRFCPDDAVSREQMAAFLNRALPLPDGSARFVDVPRSSRFRGDVQALAAAGITRGCNPPANDRFCPSDPVLRQQMAAFLDRAGLTD